MSEAAYQVEEPAFHADPVPEVVTVPRISIHGFFETPESAQTFQQSAVDRRLSKAHVSIQMGGIPAAADFFRSAPTPNLLVVETRANRDGVLAHLGQLAEVCDSGTKVIVIGHLNDVILYRELVSQGVSEYVVAPINQLQIIQTIASLYNDPEASPVGRVVAFVGAKGGSGSSTIAHNLAWSISNGLNEDVIVADMDLPFGTAGLNFNQDPLQGIAEALTSPDRLDEVFLDRLLTKCTDHLSLFAAPAVIDREFEWEDASLDAVIDTVRRQVPCFVLDIPHIWTPWAKQTLIAADEIVITAEPELANLRNCKNLVDLLTATRNNDHKPHLVLNKVGIPKRPEISPEDFAGAVDLDPSLLIPYEPQLFGTAANNGQMIEETEKSAKISVGFDELARSITGRAEAPKPRKSLLGPLLGRFSKKGDDS